MTNLFKLVLVCSLLISLGSCSVSSDDPPVLTRIVITSSFGNSVPLDEILSLTINGFDQSDNTFAIESTIIWSVSNANATLIDANNGIIRGASVGDVLITAMVEDIQDTLTISIADISNQDYHIYVSDAGGFANPPWQIMRYDQNGEHPRRFISQELAWPQDIIFFEDRNEVIVSNLNSGRITRYDATTGAYISNFATGISGPTRMKIGPDGCLYVLQWQGNGRVLRYELDGTFKDIFTDVTVTQSIGLDWDSQGNLYVSSFNSAHVRKFSPTGTDMGLFVNSRLTGPTNIWFTDDGNMRVNDWSGGVISEFDSTGVFIRSFGNNLNQIEGITQLPNGNTLVGVGGDATIKRFSPDGMFLGNLVPSGLGNLLKPNAVVLRELN